MSTQIYVCFLLKPHPFIDFLVSPAPVRNIEEFYEHKPNIRFLNGIVGTQPVLIYLNNNYEGYYLMVITDKKYFDYYIVKRWAIKETHRFKFVTMDKIIQYHGRIVE
jgi:hypothetical protein